MSDNPDFAPEDALQAVRKSQAMVAERFTRGGRLYDVIYAVLVGALAAGMALPSPFAFVNEGVVLIGLILLARWWKGRTGVWLSGVEPKKARWVAVGLGLAAAMTSAGCLYWTHAGGGAWLPIALGVVMAVLAYASARLWTRIYRRESGLSS